MDWSSFTIGNAAGFIKGPGKLFDDAMRSAATEITIGSITLAERAGNPGQVYHLEAGGTSINALGLPNRGLLTDDEASNMFLEAVKFKKRLWFSVAGFSPGEYLQLVIALEGHGNIELNLGCPNVWEETGQKPIASFDLELMGEIFKYLAMLNQPLKRRVKLSPYSDPLMIPKVAGVLKEHASQISALVVCNTFPNGVSVHDGRRTLDTTGGYGGVAGNALHHIALGQVSQFKTELEGSGIEVIGVGGINSGERLLAMREVGATGVQIGTHYGENGARVFSEIVQEAIELTE